MSKKRIVVAAAAGATVLGLTAAGASTLTFHGGQGVAQQSDEITTSCAGGQWGAQQEISFPIEDNVVNRAVLKQQYLQGCRGHEAQVVLYDGTDVVAKTTTRVLNANGLDETLNFASPVDVQSFDNYRVTFGDIVG